MSGGGEQYAGSLRRGAKPDAAEAFVQVAIPLSCPLGAGLPIDAFFAPRWRPTLCAAATLECREGKSLVALGTDVLLVGNDEHCRSLSVEGVRNAGKRRPNTPQRNCSQQLALAMI